MIKLLYLMIFATLSLGIIQPATAATCDVLGTTLFEDFFTGLRTGKISPSLEKAKIKSLQVFGANYVLKTWGTDYKKWPAVVGTSKANHAILLAEPTKSQPDITVMVVRNIGSSKEFLDRLDADAARGGQESSTAEWIKQMERQYDQISVQFQNETGLGILSDSEETDPFSVVTYIDDHAFILRIAPLVTINRPNQTRIVPTPELVERFVNSLIRRH